jgi:hypothetical protein
MGEGYEARWYNFATAGARPWEEWQRCR